MKEYIQESASKSNKRHKDSWNVYGKPFIFTQPFERDINLGSIKRTLETLLPEHMFDNVDAFFVGYFKDFFKDGREYNAMFKDGAIYLSPEQDNEKDLLDDIVHEVAHSIEDKYNDLIYEDGMLEREFVAKRRTLYHLLGEGEYNLHTYMEPEYSYKFDQHLYNDIGYDKLRTISSGLFYSPYAITSLREYWANGFENYLLGSRQKLKDLCPILYAKIEKINALEEE